jgi:dUTP pyrophosphatase
MMDSTVRFSRIHEDARAPVRGSAGAAGYDLHAAEDVVIPARQRKLVHTGIAFEIPQGYYGRVAPRSGLAAKHGIDVLAGVCDEDYRGEVCVILINHGDADFAVNTGDRIAQFIFEKIGVPADGLEEVPYDVLSLTDRGGGGFGSTGV